MSVHHITQNGAGIREIRRREGWSVDGLANEVTRLGARKGIRLSGPHLRNIENEIRNASTEYLSLIAKILDCDIKSIRQRDMSGAA